MSVLSKEIYIVQNPALCSLLIWRFICGFANKNENPTPFPLLFIVLPMILNEEIREIISSTFQSSGLRTFADKFAKSSISKSDLILSIHGKSLNLRELTLDSIKLALSSKLISLDAKNGTVFYLSQSTPRAGIPESIKSMAKCSEKLGVWCSELSIYEISTILKVGF